MGAQTKWEYFKVKAMDEKCILLKAIKEAEELNKKFLSLEIDSKGLQRSKVGSNTAEKNNSSNCELSI